MLLIWFEGLFIKNTPAENLSNKLKMFFFLLYFRFCGTGTLMPLRRRSKLSLSTVSRPGVELSRKIRENQLPMYTVKCTALNTDLPHFLIHFFHTLGITNYLERTKNQLYIVSATIFAFEGIVNVILSDPSCKEGNVRFTTVS